MKHGDQSNLGRKGLTWLKIHIISTSLFINEGSQDRNLNSRNVVAGTEAEAMKGCCLLACLSWLTQLACFSLFHIVLFDRVSLYVLAVLDLAL